MSRNLWPHQQKCIEMVRAAIARGRYRICVVSPTGSGKSSVLAEMANAHINQGGTVLALAHRDELIDQLYETFAARGISTGVIAANRSGTSCNPNRPCQIASTATLIARNLRPKASLLQIDECTHYAADKWVEVANHYRGSLCIGATATPCRSDGRALDFFNELVAPTSIKELTNLGILVPCEIIGSKSSLGSKYIAQSPADAYVTHANGSRAIVFSPHQKASEEYLEGFTRAGVPAAIVSYKTENRQELLNSHKSGKLKVIINIGILTEGYNDPLVETCIIARTIGHVGLYLQMVGRVLRSAPGKTKATLIDLNGCVHIHGPPNEEREYSLDGEGIRRKNAVPGLRSCRVCGLPLDGDVDICPECFTPAGANLTPPTVTNDPLVKFAYIRKRGPEERKYHFWKMLTAAEKAGHNIYSANYKYAGAYGGSAKSFELVQWRKEWESKR